MEMSGSNTCRVIVPVTELASMSLSCSGDTAHAQTLDGKVGDDLESLPEGKGPKVLCLLGKRLARCHQLLRAHR